MARSALLLVNPVSGKGRAREAAPQVAEALTRAGLHVKLVPTRHKGHARELLATGAQSGKDVVIAMGGDGTINEVVNGLDLARRTLGIIPMGTGNVLAKELSLPRDPMQAASVIAGGYVRAMDLGRLRDGRLFTCMLSAGIDGRIMQLLEQSRGDKMAMIRYVGYGLRALQDADYASMSTTVDGRRVRDGSSYVCIANTRSFGGPIELVSRAKAADGLLDVLSTGGDLRHVFPGMMGLALCRQVHRMPGARFHAGSHIVLEAGADPVPFQLDGEFGGLLPVEVTVQPGVLRVYVPGGKPGASGASA